MKECVSVCVCADTGTQTDTQIDRQAHRYMPTTESWESGMLMVLTQISGCVVCINENFQEQVGE